jgi:hypothetical protein
MSRKLALEIVLEELKPDLVVLSEHKLKSEDTKFVKINRYSIVSSYCRQTCGGGGVMILSRQSVQVRKLSIPSVDKICKDKEFECCIVSCRAFDFLFVLVGLYRTPGVLYDNLFLDKLEMVISLLNEKYDNLVLAGDININVLKPSNSSDRLCNILKQYNMKYLVDFPTRVTTECESAIDNIITNLPKINLSIEGIITELSDHDAQLLKINIQNKKGNNNKMLTQTCRKFTNENCDYFEQQLRLEPWVEVYNATVDSKYDIFHNKLMYYFNLCFPLIKSRVNINNKGWISLDLQKQKNEIISLSQTVRLTKDRVLKKQLKQSKKDYSKKLNYAKKEFIENSIKNSENVCTTTWKIINNDTRNFEPSSEIKLVINGQKYNEPNIVCEIFNDYFVNAVDKSVIPNLLPNYTVGPNISEINNNKKFYTKPVSDEDLNKIIMSFANKYSVGYDEIPITVIKRVRQCLIKPLAHVINSSLVSGIFPDKLKISRIITVFKKGEETDPVNYRPLSILPTISKIFERVMYLQLIDYLETNELLDKEQHGFRVGKSVVTAGINFIEALVDAIDKGNNAVGIFMDLSKAFDSVSHDILINNLKSIGIQNVQLNWFKSYIINRKQYVDLKYTNQFNQISHAKSSLRTIKHGVPQGSILGPILFLCYLRGFPSILTSPESKLCLFADDSNLIVTGKDISGIEKTAISDLVMVNEYFSSKQLLLNLDKTNLVSFHTIQNRNKPTPNIQIHNFKISQKNVTKFLGLLLDENLSWNEHILNVQKKVSSGLYALKSISKFCSIETLKTVYYAHIHSHIAFGVVLYGATSEANLLNILCLQKKSIRIIMNLNRQDSVKEYFSKLEILTVYSLYILETVMLVRFNSEHLPKLGSNHNYFTRNRNQLLIPKHNLEFYSKKPTSAGIKFLKKVPPYLLQIQNKLLFKKHFKKFLVKKAFYSFEEFLETTDGVNCM